MLGELGADRLFSADGVLPHERFERFQRFSVGHEELPRCVFSIAALLLPMTYE